MAENSFPILSTVVYSFSCCDPASFVLDLSMINYRKGGAGVQTAYFKWRRETPEEKHSVIGFVAGYNAALKDMEILNDKEKEKSEQHLPS
tara:strand:- start:669 stop:938 length:270 start_codon:yes stop_codon:yes gene_type:complete